MRMTLKKIMQFPRFSCLILLLLLIAVPTSAQLSDPESTEQKVGKKSSGSKFELFGSLGFEYRDNIYRFTESQLSMFEENDQRDVDSGRFSNMDATSDYILQPRIGMTFDAESPLGGKLRLTSWIRYNFYTKNQESGFPEGRIRLKNSLGKKGALTLEGNFVSEYFKKNYLSNADDKNRNGNISKDERTYSPANYDEYEGLIRYEHEFLNNKKDRISELKIQPFVGYQHRAYNSTFHNRDRNITFGGIQLNIELINKIDLGMTYQYENLSSPGGNELILFDETRLGTDANSDGIIKSNALLFTNIDRSANRHTFKINPSIKLSKDLSIFAGYRYRISTYTSDNPLDFERYDQEATRQRIEAGVAYDFSKSLSMEIEYERTDDDDAEDGEYSQNNVIFTVRYEF